MKLRKNEKKDFYQISTVSVPIVISKMIEFWKETSIKNIISIKKTKKENNLKTIWDLPLISGWSLCWNIIFCPQKVQDYELLCGSFILQVIMTLSHTNLKEKMGRFSWGGYNYILLFHPDVAQEVLKSNTLVNKDPIYKFFKPWLGNPLFISNGSIWKNHRKLLTPAFHFRILDDFQSIFRDHSKVLIDVLNNYTENEAFDVTEIINLCTLDIVGETAMGVNINAQNRSDNEYANAVQGITSSCLQWFTKPWYWFPLVLRYSSLGRKLKTCIETIHRTDKKVIHEKKVNFVQQFKDNQITNNLKDINDDLQIKKKRAFLDMLLHHHMNDPSFTEENIREQVAGIMFAAQDTTTMCLSWTLYFLGIYHDIQEKVFQEVLDIFGHDLYRNITSEDLRQMKYLECVIKETLRIYPPGPFILRKNLHEVKIGNCLIPAGSSLVVAIYSIHHNPEVFENPEVFDPNRFLPENCQNRHPYAFLPFSAGPRNCIGQKYAMLEMKTILADIIRHFKIHSLDTRDKINISADVVLRPIAGLNLTIEKRRII